MAYGYVIMTEKWHRKEGNQFAGCTCVGAMYTKLASLQGVRHSKPSEVVEEIKTQLKDKVQAADNPLADVIVAAGKEKLSKKPDDKQTNLTSEYTQTAYTLVTQLIGDVKHVQCHLENDIQVNQDIIVCH